MPTSIGLWVWQKPRIKWDGVKYEPVNYEATSVSLSWNIELDIQKLHDLRTENKE